MNQQSPKYPMFTILHRTIVVRAKTEMSDELAEETIDNISDTVELGLNAVCFALKQKFPDFEFMLEEDV